MEIEATTPVEPVAVPVGGFDGFFREQFPIVARSMALVVRDFDQGQEIAQEGFARLLSRWDDMRSAEHARNFVFRVSLNLAHSHLRKQRPLSLFGLLRDDQADPADASDAAVDRLRIDDALGALSPRQRACVVLVDYVGYGAAEAAAILRTRPSTVRVHLMRGRNTLREHLSPREER